MRYTIIIAVALLCCGHAAAGDVLDRQPLVVFAEHFNQDNERQLKIADTAAGQRRISGYYKQGDPDGVVKAIRNLFPDLVVLETDYGWIIESPNQR